MCFDLTQPKMKNKQLLAQPKDIALKTYAGFFAFGFGSGLAPVAPGTFGTLAAVPLYLILIQLSWPMLLYRNVIPF